MGQYDIRFLQRWHELERFGADMCDILAESGPNLDRREKWRVLARIEKAMVRLIAERLVRERLEIPTYAVSGEALRLAQMVQSDPWPKAMATLRAEILVYLEELRRNEEEADEPFHAIAKILTVHEEAWLAFADAELAGRPDISLERIEELLQIHERREGGAIEGVGSPSEG